VDGEFGPVTVRALQRRLNETEPGHDLAVDGDMAQVVNNKTVTFRRGAKTQTARYLQQRLNWGAGPVGIDGQIGPNTIKGLQRYIGVGQDGQWGPNTTMALQRTLNRGAF
jgi:lysozyme family protein